MRVFLDTNVLAGALTGRGLCAEIFELVLQSHDLLTSESVLSELERILPGKLGQSDIFVTGDKALLDLQSVEFVPIVSPRGLWEILASEA